jgi:hypothetical protein
MKKFLVIAMLLIATISWSDCGVSPCNSGTTFIQNICYLPNDTTTDINPVGRYKLSVGIFGSLGLVDYIGVEDLVITENSWYLECTNKLGQTFPCNGAIYSWYVDLQVDGYAIILNLPPYTIHARLIDNMLEGFICGMCVSVY